MCTTLTESRRTDEDVHHQCQTPRCVDPDHLVVLSTAEHAAHHAAERRPELCSVHNIAYARRDPTTGRAICPQCRREAHARYLRRNPLTEQQRLRCNELARLRYDTPEAKAKRRARRARTKALKAQRDLLAS